MLPLQSSDFLIKHFTVIKLFIVVFPFWPHERLKLWAWEISLSRIHSVRCFHSAKKLEKSVFENFFILGSDFSTIFLLLFKTMASTLFILYIEYRWVRNFSKFENLVGYTLKSEQYFGFYVFHAIISSSIPLSQTFNLLLLFSNRNKTIMFVYWRKSHSYSFQPMGSRNVYLFNVRKEKQRCFFPFSSQLMTFWKLTFIKVKIVSFYKYMQTGASKIIIQKLTQAHADFKTLC